ncbi:TPA_asm: UL37.5 uORF 3 [Human alphaherpesvirus 1]|nr:TPA_asm: UL37.5 uORF 3 [Human alphaherpesvirus 1]
MAPGLAQPLGLPAWRGALVGQVRQVGGVPQRQKQRPSTIRVGLAQIRQDHLAG